MEGHRSWTGSLAARKKLSGLGFERFAAFVAPLRVHHNTVAVNPQNDRNIAPRAVLFSHFAAFKQDALLELFAFGEQSQFVLVFVPGVDRQNG